MNFSEALTLLKQGRTVTTKNGDANFHLSLNRTTLIFDRGGVCGFVTELGIGYILAEDWEEVKA